MTIRMEMRLYPATKEKLDSLCVMYGDEHSTPCSVSHMIRLLIDQAYKEATADANEPGAEVSPSLPFTAAQVEALSVIADTYLRDPTAIIASDDGAPGDGAESPSLRSRCAGPCGEEHKPYNLHAHKGYGGKRVCAACYKLRDLNGSGRNR